MPGPVAADEPVSLQELGITLGPLGQIINSDNRELISEITDHDLSAWPWRCIGTGMISLIANMVNQWCTAAHTAWRSRHPRRHAVLG